MYAVYILRFQYVLNRVCDHLGHLIYDAFVSGTYMDLEIRLTVNLYI